MPITLSNNTTSNAALMAAIASGNEADIAAAFQELQENILQSVRSDMETYQETNDEQILARRGVRALTSTEKKWYEKFIEANRGANPKQAVTDLIALEGMPTTVIEDVFKDLVAEHPLLTRINFQYVGFLTKWLLHDHSVQAAAWGEINEEIVKEITSGFKVIKLDQAKLSAFALIAKDMLDLGPQWLDTYMRAILKEALAVGLEAGIVIGSGLNEPAGFNRDIHEGVSFSTTTGYPVKTAVAVTDFRPASYGGLVAKLVKTEKGRSRTFTSVTLLCNMVDYLTKVMPATTVLNTAGDYKRDIFPFPTEVISTEALTEGKAILCLPDEYFLGVGSSIEGTIEYSDEYKFLEDARTYKTKMHATGRGSDNTIAILLDISGLKPAFITIQNIDEVIA